MKAVILHHIYMGNMDYPDILHLSSGFVQSIIHSSNITNNVAAFSPFNLTWEGGGAGSDVCVFVNLSHHLPTFDSVVTIHLMTCTFDNVSIPHDLHI